MPSYNTPRMRVLVDWDGDGWINRGGRPTDLPNLAVSPLTLYNQVVKFGIWNEIGQKSRLSAYNYTVYYDPTDRGLFAHEILFGSPDYFYIGHEVGSVSGGSSTFLFTDFPAGFNGNTYTVQFYIKGISDYVGKNFEVQIYNGAQGGLMPAVDAIKITQPAKSITITGDYTLVSHTFTLNTNSVGPVVRIRQTSAAPYATIRITGLSVLKTTTTANLPYNVGTTISLHEDIEEYIQNVTWQLGMSGPLDTVASEGTASITVANVNKEFSMEHPSSFLYNDNAFPQLNPIAESLAYPYDFPTYKFKPGVLVVIEVMSEVTGLWVEMWRGFLENLPIGTGVSSPTATIEATQGLFKFDGTRTNLEVLQDVTADEIIVALINSGWITAVVPNQAAVGKTQLRDTYTYDVMANSQAYELDTGIDTYEFAGESWQANETSPVDVIKQVMDVEQGLFFIDRLGKVRFLHRDRIYSTEPTEPADVVLTDSDTNAVGYTVTQGLVNSVKVEYFPKEITTGIIWSSKEPIVVNPNYTFKYTAKLENPENSKLTALSVNSFEAAVLPSTIIVKDMSDTVISTTASNIVFKTIIKNGEIELIIQSYFVAPVKIMVVLKGTILLSYGGMSLVRSHLPGQVGIGVRSEPMSSKLLTTPEQASALGDYILQLKGRQYATFKSMQISSRDNTWLERILTTTIGTRVKIHETNVGGIDHRVMVVGESGSWSSGILTMDYTTRPADNVPYTVLNDTPLSSEGFVY